MCRIADWISSSEGQYEVRSKCAWIIFQYQNGGLFMSRRSVELQTWYFTQKLTNLVGQSRRSQSAMIKSARRCETSNRSMSLILLAGKFPANASIPQKLTKLLRINSAFGPVAKRRIN